MNSDQAPADDDTTAPENRTSSAMRPIARAWTSDPLLRRREADVRLLAPAAQATLRDLCAIGRQKLASAHLLWTGDQTAEGLQLARAAFVSALHAVESAAELAKGLALELATVARTDAPAPSPMDLDARAAAALTTLDANAVVRTAAAEGAHAANSSLPTRNRDLTPDDRGRFAALTTAAVEMIEAAAPLTLSIAGVKMRRFGRVAVGAMLLSLLGWGTGRCLAVDDRFTITASASYDTTRFAAANAADGKLVTEWLLPNRTPGWIEVKFSRRDLRRIRIRNAHNPPHEDRGTRGFRIEFSREGNLVHSSKHAFTSFTPEPQSMDLALDVDDVDGLRIAIDEYQGWGGGLSELSWK